MVTELHGYTRDRCFPSFFAPTFVASAFVDIASPLIRSFIVKNKSVS
jgi:hypothetical protein